jgi:PAS domain S-box-containing protein
MSSNAAANEGSGLKGFSFGLGVSRKPMDFWMRTLAGGLAYGGLLWLGLALFRELNGLAAIAPAGAVGLAMILRQSGKAWPARLGACFIAHCIVGAMTGAPLGSAVVQAALDTGELLVIAALIRRGCESTFDVARPDDLMVFVIVTMTAPWLSALVAAMMVSLGSGVHGLATIAIRALAHGLGFVVLTPALFMLRMTGLTLPTGVRPRDIVVSAIVLVADLGVVFGQTRYPLLFLALPPIALMAFRFELAGAVVSILVTALAASVATYAGQGPIALFHGSMTERICLLQLFLATFSVLVLSIAMTLVQRRLRLKSVQDAWDEAEQARVELAKSEEAYRMLAEHSSDIILRTDRDGIIRYCSPSVRVQGYEPEDLIGRHRDAFTHPDDLEASSRRRAALIEGRSPPAGHGVARLRRADGEWVWMEAKAQVIHDADDSDIGQVAVLRDITEQRKFDDTLARSERMFRLLVQGVTDYAIYMLDQNGCVASWNAGAERMQGYKVHDILGRHFSCFYTAEDQAAGLPEKALKQARSKRRFATQAWRVRKDGTLFWADMVVSAIFDDRELIGFTFIARDVTEQKAIEEALIASRIADEAANQAKSDFLANMSHELRTPLTAIIGFSGLLAAKGKLGEMEAMFVKRIGGASRNLLSLINDILDISKVDAGQIELEREPIVLRGLAEEALQLFGEQARAKGLTLSADFGAGLPEQVLGDPVRLTQIITNFISNAIKFTDAGYVTLRLSLAASGSVRFEVSDTGAGVPYDRVEKLFHRFVQADSSTTRLHGGTGLGLAICKGLVEQMGGEIGVQSIVGVGSIFWFEIPLIEIGEQHEDVLTAPAA